MKKTMLAALEVIKLLLVAGVAIEAVFDAVLHVDWLAASLAWSLLQTASNSAVSFSFSIRKSAHACV